MNIRLLYFARLREVFGLEREDMTLDQAEPSLADLLTALRARGGVWSEELAEDRAYRMAINQDIAPASARLHDRDEVAIFPPVTGG